MGSKVKCMHTNVDRFCLLHECNNSINKYDDKTEEFVQFFKVQ